MNDYETVYFECVSRSVRRKWFPLGWKKSQTLEILHITRVKQLLKYTYAEFAIFAWSISQHLYIDRAGWTHSEPS